MKKWKRLLALISVALMVTMAGCSEKLGISVIAQNAGPSWQSEDLKLAQDFRGVLENGTVEAPAQERGGDYYNVTIKNDLGEWRFKLWVNLDDNSPAAAMDEAGVVRLVSDYDSGVIRQIFSDYIKSTATPK